MRVSTHSGQTLFKLCVSVVVYVTCLGLVFPVYGQSLEKGVQLLREAIALRKEGNYQRALPLYERSLAICEKVLGPQHPEMAIGLGNLAGLYKDMGDHAKALPLYERSLAICEKVLGPQHPDTAAVLNGLAGLYIDMGVPAKALPLYERSLAIREKSLGTQHPDTAASLANLAGLYALVGDYAKALPLHERSLAISEKSLGSRHPEMAIGLGNLAFIYRGMGDHAKALPLYERSLAIREKVLGPQHPDTAAVLNGLAGLYKDMGDHAKALPLYERSLAICEKVLGPQHPDTAAVLNGLAGLYIDMGDHAKALPLYERSLAICEKVLGPQHPDTAAVLSNLAVFTYKTGDVVASRAYASKAIAGEQRALQAILSLDEKMRLSFQKDNVRYSYVCILRPEPAAQMVLRQKGVVLDSLLEDRSLALLATNDSDGRAKLQEISTLQAKLAKFAFDKDREDEAAKLEEQIGQLQRSLSTRANIGGRARAGADITIDAIVPALANGSTLLDLIQFDDPKLKGEEAKCYGAVITGADGTPAFVRIDGGAEIDRAVDALRVAINQCDVKETETQTKFLSEKLWQPIVAKIPEGTKQLILCPDANLNFLSFAALLGGDGRFVAEKFPITYIGSGRDLARKASGDAAKNLAVFTDPVFDASDTAYPTEDMVAMRSAEVDVFGTVNLPPLPGTKAEAQEIETLAKQSGWDVNVTTGDEATESSVRNTKKPGVLHLATHGFYLNSFVPAGEDGTRGMSVVGPGNENKNQNENGVDPMRASGVALTGAQQTLKLWSQRKAPDPETDGILTAEEVASLDLNGTWLVTLSACETGVGEARSGEGVFGLRRAFMIAGAENLLMTLWPVADDTTASIMADFYKEALATGDAPGSLAKVQRDWLVKLREEKGLATAIREAGPFAMVMMTAPSHPPVELPPIAKAELASKPATALSEQPPSDAPASEKKSSWWPF
jgi:CHAT domain-containing protein